MMDPKQINSQQNDDSIIDYKKHLANKYLTKITLLEAKLSKEHEKLIELLREYRSYDLLG